MQGIVCLHWFAWGFKWYLHFAMVEQEWRSLVPSFGGSRACVACNSKWQRRFGAYLWQNESSPHTTEVAQCSARIAAEDEWGCLGMRGYGASTTFDTHAEQHDSGSDAASDGECAAVLPDSDCEDEQAAEQAEDDVFEYDVFLDAGDVQCVVCSSTAHATLSCPFCCASFWADVKESDKTRQAIFTGAGIQLTSDQANLHVVLADGDCLFTCLGLELQRNLVPDFLESENIGQEVRSYFLAFVREHTGKFVFECPLPLWLEAASGLDFDAYLQGMATGSGIRDSSWGGFAEAHLICLQFGCKVEFYEQCRVGDVDLFQLAITGGDAESVMVCRLVWTGAHYNILELAADVSSTAAN